MAAVLSSSLGLHTYWECALLFSSFIHPKQNSMALPGGSGIHEEWSTLRPRHLAESSTQEEINVIKFNTSDFSPTILGYSF